MFQFIIRAAAKVETWWVDIEGLNYKMAWKLKSLLYKIGTLNSCVLARVVFDVGL